MNRLTEEKARQMAGLRKTIGKSTGRRRKLRPCPLCAEKLGVREMRAHLRQAHGLHWSKVSA